MTRAVLAASEADSGVSLASIVVALVVPSIVVVFVISLSPEAVIAGQPGMLLPHLSTSRNMMQLLRTISLQ